VVEGSFETSSLKKPQAFIMGPFLFMKSLVQGWT
jgi:hypothetical protein